MDFKSYMLTEGKEAHVFCDMDGVLVDWEKAFKEYVGKDIDDIPKKESHDICRDLPVEWWINLQWLPDGKELWNYINKNFQNVYILSSPTKDKESKSVKGKWKWLENNNIVNEIGRENIFITPDKYKYVREDGISILIDDTPKKINSWIDAKGIGILHKSTADTISQLKQYLY